MKNNIFKRMAAICLMVGVFVAMGTAIRVEAATIALNGQVTLRPLTPTEISLYSLTNAQFSAGIGTVAIGEPVYLDAMVAAAIAPSNILGVTWSLTTNQQAAGFAGGVDQQSVGHQCAALQDGGSCHGWGQWDPLTVPSTGGPDLFPPGCRRTIHRPGHDHHDG